MVHEKLQFSYRRWQCNQVRNKNFTQNSTKIWSLKLKFWFNFYLFWKVRSGLPGTETSSWELKSIFTRTKILRSYQQAINRLPDWVRQWKFFVENGSNIDFKMSYFDFNTIKLFLNRIIFFIGKSKPKIEFKSFLLTVYTLE